MTDQHDHPLSVRRRDFLRNSLFAGAGAALVVLTADEASAATPAQPESKPTGAKAGYQETQHIRDYYRTASF